MKRMKTFLIYALLIVALWIFSDILMHFIVNGRQNNSNNVNNVNLQQASEI